MSASLRYLQRVFFITIAAALLCRVESAQAVEPTVPLPRGFVSDYAGVIDAATVRELDALIAELKQKTGAEIAVVVVKTTQPLTAFDYAMKLAEAWKPGEKGKDNGVVFLVAVEDRELFILTGYGVEGALPDGRVGAIRDELITPAFRRGDFSGGVRAATLEMARIIAADAGVQLSGVPSASPRTRSTSPTTILPALLILLFILLLILDSRWLGGLIDPRFRGRRHWGHWHGHRGGFGGGFGGFGGGGGGGFGGFGGGGFGGGGAGGRW